MNFRPSAYDVLNLLELQGRVNTKTIFLRQKM